MKKTLTPTKESIDSLRNYEASKQLTDTRFKRLVGVQRTTFKEMLAVLNTAYQLKHAKGGRKLMINLEELTLSSEDTVMLDASGSQISIAIIKELANDYGKKKCQARRLKRLSKSRENCFFGYHCELLS
ncbi:Transposase-like protein, IS1381 ISSpn7 [Streptococcus pneumoniae AP200]|nr:Transposase-like protein, IS1381 ISSpn7 [Streptococcus pneumoniae AP200]